jgi:hypothetical protein
MATWVSLQAAAVCLTCRHMVMERHLFHGNLSAFSGLVSFFHPAISAFAVGAAATVIWTLLIKSQRGGRLVFRLVVGLLLIVQFAIVFSVVVGLFPSNGPLHG